MSDKRDGEGKSNDGEWTTVMSRKYHLTDADGETIDGETYDDPNRALDARARLMAEHEDGDEVTIEEETTGPITELNSGGDPRIEPEFDQPRDGHERANQVVEDEGGLPEGNPFSEVVRELHEDGESWRSIFETMDEVFDVVDAAAYEEGTKLLPDWKVAAVVPDDRATSGERYKYYERSAETPGEAEERVEQATGYRVDPDETEQVGVSKVS